MSNIVELLKAEQEKNAAYKPFFDKIAEEKEDYLLKLQVLKQVDQDAYSNFPGVRGKIEMQLQGLATTDSDYATLANTYQKLLTEDGDWEAALREALISCKMVERYAADIDLCSCINKTLNI